MDARPELILRPGERLDDLQTGGFRILQKPGTFCFGTDAVLLADFAAPRKRDHIADLGCGNGAIALLMAAHCSEVSVDAVELQPELADMAQRSAELNGITRRVRVCNLDMRSAWKTLGRGGHSLVVCNPPYSREASGPVNEADAVAAARHEDGLTVDEVCASARALLKYGGRFCAVYPADRAAELLYAMTKNGMEPKRLRTVSGRLDRAPKRILAEAVYGAAPGLKWLPPLVLYNDDGTHSAEWRRIYGTD